MSRKVKSAVLWTVIAVLVIGVSMGGTYAIYEAVRTGTAMKAEKRISEQKERENEEKARKEEERKKKEAERLSQTAETAREKLNTALGLLGKSVIRSRNEETLRRSAEAASSESDISRMDDITRLIAGLYSYSGSLAEGTLTTLMSLHSDDASYYDEQTSAQRTESAERIKALISDGDYRKAYAEETSLKKALDAYDQEKKNEEEQKRKAESFLSKSGTFEDGRSRRMPYTRSRLPQLTGTAPRRREDSCHRKGRKRRSTPMFRMSGKDLPEAHSHSRWKQTARRTARFSRSRRHHSRKTLILKHEA